MASVNKELNLSFCFLLINCNLSHMCLMGTILDKAILGGESALKSTEVGKQKQVQGKM